MKISEYNEIVGELVELKSSESADSVAHLFPELSKETLWSIHSQLIQRKTRDTLRSHYTNNKPAEYYSAYLKDRSEGKKEILMTMARDLDVSPSLLSRIILEQWLMATQFEGERPPKNVLTQLRNEPSLIDDPVLAAEVQQCHLEDTVYGPYVEIIKRCLGEEYEFKLQKKLKEFNLDYVEEHKLKGKGFDKTPDAKLVLPIAVNGRVVNWIESKASFGDVESHQGYKNEQFHTYWNRFGSGLVIYWFGYIEELDVDKGIMIMDHFPEHVEYFKPAARGLKQTAHAEKSTL